MMSVTRSSAGCLLALTLALAAGGCDSGDDIAGNHDEGSSDHGTDAQEVSTVTTLQNVGKGSTPTTGPRSRTASPP